MTKPRIPKAIQDNYEKMEAEKTRLLVSVQTQAVVEKEAETERKRAVIGAEKEAEVENIRNAALVAKREADQRISAIEGTQSKVQCMQQPNRTVLGADAMALAREKSRVDAAFYAAERTADGNRVGPFAAVSHPLCKFTYYARRHSCC